MHKNNITLLIVANFVSLETAKSAHRIRCDDAFSHIIRMHSMPTTTSKLKRTLMPLRIRFVLVEVKIDKDSDKFALTAREFFLNKTDFSIYLT